MKTDAEEGSTRNTETMSRIKDGTEELIVGTPTGCKICRSVRRRSREDAADPVFFNSVRGMSWCLVPDGAVREKGANPASIFGHRWVVMNTPEYDSTLAGLVENAVKQVKEIESTKPQLTVRIDQRKQAVISDTASLANIMGAYADDAKYTTDLKTQCEFEASDYEKGQNSITGEIAVTVKALEIMLW